MCFSLPSVRLILQGMAGAVNDSEIQDMSRNLQVVFVHGGVGLAVFLLQVALMMRIYSESGEFVKLLCDAGPVAALQPFCDSHHYGRLFELDMLMSCLRQAEGRFMHGVHPS